MWSNENPADSVSDVVIIVWDVDNKMSWSAYVDEYEYIDEAGEGIWGTDEPWPPSWLWTVAPDEH